MQLFPRTQECFEALILSRSDGLEREFPRHFSVVGNHAECKILVLVPFVFGPGLCEFLESGDLFCEDRQSCMVAWKGSDNYALGRLLQQRFNGDFRRASRFDADLDMAANNQPF